MLPALELGYPFGNVLLEWFVDPIQDPSKVNRCDSLSEYCAGGFLLEIFVKLPGAILTFKVIRRKADEEKTR